MSYTVRIPATPRGEAVAALRDAKPILDGEELNAGQFDAVLAALPGILDTVGGPDDDVTVEVIGSAVPENLAEARHQDEVIYLAIRTARPAPELPEEPEEEPLTLDDDAPDGVEDGLHDR